MGVWKKISPDHFDLSGADPDSVAEYYVRRELLDSSNSLNRMELWKRAYRSSPFWGDGMPQQRIEEAIDRLIERGDIVTEEVPRDASVTISETLHRLAK